MALDWDVLLDDVSIKDEISTFSIRQEKGGYAKEVTLFSVDPDFFDSFTYDSTPELRIEVKTKLVDTWVSQGKFYIEKPAYSLTPSQKISRGIWGRSETAKAGKPFAEKVTETWDANTTIQGIINEMVDLVGLSVIFNIDDYPIYANTYSVDLKYPIEVISELCTFAGAFLSCDTAGNLVIEKEIFHTVTADYTVTDDDIRELSETISYPDFGNRIKVSSFGSNTGYQIEVKSIGASDCLPADGVSELVVLALITLDGEPVEDNILVSWESESGISLEETLTPTQSYLLSKQQHKATNYNTVEVDFPVSDVIGIWAYSDSQKTNNYWDTSLTNCSFDGKEISVHNAFQYCDQTLLITYITTGVAVNTVIAGSTPVDSTVTAELDGAEGELEIVVGNICSCGSSINTKKIPDSEICVGNRGVVLVWAEVGNVAADGLIATFDLDGCGELSSTKKTLGDVIIENEKAIVYNIISGVTQVDAEIEISDSAVPEVYEITDTSKSTDLYSSHSEKIIDLNTELENGIEVYIDYIGAGAGLVSWLTRDLDEEDDDCEADIIIRIADGTEAGLEDEITFTLQDCITEADIAEGVDDAQYSSYSGSGDPDSADNETQDGGLDDCEYQCGDLEGAAKTTCIENCQSSAILTECDVQMLNIWANVENAEPETKDQTRFGVPTDADCPEVEGDYACSCSEICEREMINRGNTFEHDETVHEQSLAYGDEGTPEYNEAYNTLRADHIATCEENCEDTRESICECVLSGPDVMTPGEIAEFICADGTSLLYTMPMDACGTITMTVGCCSKDIRSTDGGWVYDAGASWTNIYGCPDDGNGNYCFPYSLSSGFCGYDIIEGAIRYVGSIANWYGTACGGCLPACREGACIPPTWPACPADPICGVNNDWCSLLPRMESVYNWECLP